MGLTGENTLGFPVKEERAGGVQRHELNGKNASYQTFGNKEKGLEFHISGQEWEITYEQQVISAAAAEGM